MTSDLAYPWARQTIPPLAARGIPTQSSVNKATTTNSQIADERSKNTKIETMKSHNHKYLVSRSQLLYLRKSSTFQTSPKSLPRILVAPAYRIAHPLLGPLPNFTFHLSSTSRTLHASSIASILYVLYPHGPQLGPSWSRLPSSRTNTDRAQRTTTKKSSRPWLRRVARARRRAAPSQLLLLQSTRLKKP